MPTGIYKRKKNQIKKQQESRRKSGWFKNFEETKKKMRLASQRRKKRDGFINSPATRRKMVENAKHNLNYGMKNKKLSKKAIQKKKQFMKNWWEENRNSQKVKERNRKISLKRLKRKEEMGYINSYNTKRKMSATRKRLFKEGKLNPPKTAYKKGNVPYIKGKHHSKETKGRIGESLKDLYKKGILEPQFKGKHLSIRHKLKISESEKGKILSIETKEKIRKKIKKISNLPENIRKAKERRAKQIFPLKDSSIEVKIQNFLKQLGIEFFTHQYMKIEHGYQCDILIPSMNLVIECDGNYWHKYPVGLEKDHIRTKELIEKGFKVLRLWEVEINEMTIDSFRVKLNNTKK